MTRLTTQQQLDCLIKRFDELIKKRGEAILLNEHDINTLIMQCGFTDKHEIAFYVRSLDSEGLLKSHCNENNEYVGASITINGYRYLDTIQWPE